MIHTRSTCLLFKHHYLINFRQQTNIKKIWPRNGRKIKLTPEIIWIDGDASIFCGGPQVSRQNFLSHGKTFFLSAKLSFSRQLFHFTIKFHNFTNRKGRVINMAAEEDWMDDFIQKDFFRGFTYREICIFLGRNHECVVSITTLKRKVKQLDLLR